MSTSSLLIELGVEALGEFEAEVEVVCESALLLLRERDLWMGEGGVEVDSEFSEVISRGTDSCIDANLYADVDAKELASVREVVFEEGSCCSGVWKLV